MGMLSDWICAECGMVDLPKVKARSSGWLTLVLLLLCVLPGLVHWLWRVTHGQRECAHCGSPRIVPTDSPAGRELLASRRTT